MWPLSHYTDLHDEVVADLEHQRDEPRRHVIVPRVLPDEQQSVHDRLEQVHERGELVELVQLLEVLLERFEELDIVIGLLAGELDLGEEALWRVRGDLNCSASVSLYGVPSQTSHPDDDHGVH